MSVGSRMKERRESLGLTQVQLADMLGVTKGAIGNYETDANSPKASILYKVFEVLKCDANYIFQDEIQERREYTASPHEMEHLVKKYRTLDEYGKEAVDGVLETEHRRCKEQRERSAPLPDENVLPLRCSTQAASAGTGCYLGPEEWDPIYVQENDLTRRASFCVPVSGNSMEPRYHDGDILVIDDNAEVELGQVGLYTIDGEGFVKIYGGDHLISLNPDYPNIPFIEDSRCNGKVIGILEPDWIVEE